MVDESTLFEKVIAHLLNAEHSVKLDCMYDGQKVERQIDGYLAIQTSAILPKVRIGIECRKRSRPVSIDQIDAFASLVSDCKLHIGMMVSFTGYQSGAISKAKSSNIELYWFRRSKEKDIANVPYDRIDGPVEYTYRLDCTPVSHNLTVEEKGLLSSRKPDNENLYNEKGVRIDSIPDLIIRNLEKEVLIEDKKAGISKFNVASREIYTHETWKGEKLVMKVKSIEIIFNARKRMQMEFKEPKEWWILEDVISNRQMFVMESQVEKIRRLFSDT